jgi:hypothetical protein
MKLLTALTKKFSVLLITFALGLASFHLPSQLNFRKGFSYREAKAKVGRRVHLTLGRQQPKLFHATIMFVSESVGEYDVVAYIDEPLGAPRQVLWFSKDEYGKWLTEE